MPGFANGVMYADNVQFNGADNPASVTTNGQLLIGSTVAPNIKVGSLTSPLGTITIGYSSPNITLDLAGGSTGIDSVGVDATNGGGTNPVLPTAGGLVTNNGATVAAGTNPVRTVSTAANVWQTQVQISQALAATDATKIGLANFDSAAFDVDANGFVQLNGGGIAATSFDVQANTAPGTDPVVPTAAGVVTVNGAAVANHSVVLETRSRAANAYNLEVQYSAAAAATDATKSGVAHFDSARFSVDANGFVTINGAGVAETITGNSGGALSPTAGNWNILGASTAAGTSPVTTSGAVSTLTVNVQKSQAIAATDATKVGLANFDSAKFTVDANGFVSTSGTGIGQTITGDSGGALSPTAGNWNILGGPGVTTSGSGSTLTINSVVFTDQGGNTTVTSDSGSFATAAITLTTPATPAQGELLQFVATSAAALVIDAASTHLIRIGASVTSAGGTMTSTAIGDSVTLRYRASDTTWYATSVIGTWLPA